MYCSIAGEETRSAVNFILILLPVSLYIMGLVRGKTGHYLFLSGMAFHLIGILVRGLETGHVPLTEKHDTISFMAFSMAAGYLYPGRIKNVRNLDVLVLPLIAIFMFVSFIHVPVNTVSPFMKTPWFYLHSFFYFSSYGLFGISSCLGVLYLLSMDNGLEALQYRIAVSGWVLFSLSLIAGSIWFFIAHGTYWLWTSKELWTTLTWFFFGLYLHARLMKRLRGRTASVLGIAGFMIALFTYFGVGTIIPSPPTQF